MTERRHWLPWAMIWFRVFLCPVIITGAYRGWNGKWLGLIVLIALVDDVFDGILARRWGCSTTLLRRADSAADTVFYIGVAAALWLRQPGLLRSHWLLLAALAVLEITRHVFDCFKFGKSASYHSYLAKSWGLVMATAIIAVLSFSRPHWLVGLAIVFGIVADFEGLVMSILLPSWQCDVRSIPVALRLRRTILAAEVNGA